ncbi:HTH-type transcriptional repressor NagR [Cupriavidus yeoncheonensis]|uniref:HTH-type transcriptional repressor NagR n=1 Tax=Cupriavidus yeoncheonensis TaxID=1462994 RepID=A0A916MYE8_9BURK|nr:GntR family transcriptional regulator [Cupriavidus yeoncheonensis]CAG2157681.1 HTH-type transcriptional repressor NagR [Cupriavidus yeoncheonensis]
MAKGRVTERRGKIPAYIQVASALRRRIESGDWQPLQQISTLEELEQEFQVARVTVRQAVDLLENEGLVTRKQGRGTFVNEHVNDKRWLQLATTWDGLLASIRDNVPRYIRVPNPPAFPRLAEGEGKPASSYVFLRSVQMKDGTPFGVVNVHLARDIFEKAREEFTKHTVLPVLAMVEGLEIRDATQTMVIGTADRETAELLQVSLSAPTAECRCVVIDADGVAVYVADITYRSDCVKLTIDLLEGLKRQQKDGRRTRQKAA